MVDAKERRSFVNTIRGLVNVLVLSNFLAFHVFFWATKRETIDVQIIWWVSFITTLLAANILVYYKYEKKPPNKAFSGK